MSTKIMDLPRIKGISTAQNHVFVFGSNEAGIHGAGAAQYASRYHGAQWGKGYGHHGQSFAIPTKDVNIDRMPLSRIAGYVQGFLAYATGHKKLIFQVTAIGTGLAGFRHEEMAPLFERAPVNCQFDEVWRPFLGDNARYWGTF